MKIDFNNVRRQAVNSMDRLTKKLNDSIIKVDHYAKPNDVEWEVNVKGYVLVDADYIQNEMDNLRMLIGSIAMTYKPDDEDFKDIYEELFPEENQSMASFNYIEDEE